jgi:hypothetical protein
MTFQRRTRSKTKVCRVSLLETIQEENVIPKGDFQTTFGIRDAKFDLPSNGPKRKQSGPYMMVNDTANGTTDTVPILHSIEFYRLLEAKQRTHKRYFAGPDVSKQAWYDDNVIVATLHFCKAELNARSTIIVEPSLMRKFDTWVYGTTTSKGGAPVVEVDDTSSEVEYAGEALAVTTTKELLKTFGTFFEKDQRKNRTAAQNVLVPYNVGENHWLLVHLHLIAGNVQCDVYDSFYQQNIKTDRLQLIAQALGQGIWRSRFHGSTKSFDELTAPEFNVDFVRYRTVQSDGEACGVYTCLAGALLMEGKTKADIANVDIDPTLISKCRVFFFRLLASRSATIPPLGGTRKKSNARTNVHRKRSVHRRLRLRRLPR